MPVANCLLLMTKYFKNVSLLTTTALVAINCQAISLDLVSISGPNVASRGSLRFDGTTDSFSFLNVTAAGPTKGFSFTLTGSDGVGDSFGDFGTIDGIFKIGAITTVGTKQTAPVTLLSGPSTLTINDGAGFQLLGKIDWVEIFTDGTAGGLNSGGSINLKDITYGGSEMDLIALGNQATTSIQFGFGPGKSLNQLIANTTVYRGNTIPNVNTSSYTGDLSAVPPVPDSSSTSLLLGSAMLALACVRRKFTPA